MKKLILSSLCALSLATFASEPTMTPRNGYPKFALGADISWTPYIEANRLHIYYKSTDIIPSQITDIPEMVSDHGIDAARLRVWVNPRSEVAMSGFTFSLYDNDYEEMSTFGTCSVEEMVALARRFAMQGQRVMVVFQMSDSWADPARQFIPSDWADCSTTEELISRASEHVAEALTLLRENNVNVAWVQLGNEVNFGMLRWQMPKSSAGVQTPQAATFGCEISGNANNPSQSTRNFVKMFAELNAVAKSIYPETKSVLHLTKTAEWGSVDWTLSTLRSAGFSPDDCDYVGLSLYPGNDDGRESYTAQWRNYADLGIATINKINSVYGYRTLLCEIGMNNEYSLSANTSGVPSADLQQCYIDQCNKDVRAFTEYLIEKLASDSSPCDGLFYWEPETDYMKGYTKGACVSATPGAAWPRDKIVANDWWRAVAEHSSFPDGGLTEYRLDDSGIESIILNPADQPTEWYNLQGVRISDPQPGINIMLRGDRAVKVLK